MSAVPAVVAFPVVALLIWLGLRTSAGRRLVSLPSGERWAERETPSFGGVGIFAGLWAGVGAALAAGGVHASSELFGILGGVSIVFVAGLIDDLRSLPPLAKLAAQVGAAALVLSTGLSVHIITNHALAAASEDDVAELGKLVPFIADKTAADGRATAYVCVRGRCELPVSDPETLAKLLARRVPYPPA